MATPGEIPDTGAGDLAPIDRMAEDDGACATTEGENARFESEGHPNSTAIRGADPQQPDVYQRLLSAPEMVESILYFLPPKDLIQTRGLSRYFRDVVDSSPKLQRAAFLKPEGVVDLIEGDDLGEDQHTGPVFRLPDTTAPRVNNAARRRLCAWVFDPAARSITPNLYTAAEARALDGLIHSELHWCVKLHRWWSAGNSSPSVVFPVTLNPAFPPVEVFGSPPPGMRICRACCIAWQTPKRMEHLSMGLTSSFLGSKLPNSAARYWDMLISQPSVTKCTMDLTLFSITSLGAFRHLTFYRPSGLTMRDVFEAFRGMGVGIQYGKKLKGGEHLYIGLQFDGCTAVLGAQEAIDVEEGAGVLTCLGDGKHSRRSADTVFGERCEAADPGHENAYDSGP